MLTLTSTQDDAVLTLNVSGELALETGESFGRAIQQLPSDIRSVRVNCEELTFIDSTGVNALLQAALRWHKAGVDVHVERLSEELRDMLTVLGFFEVLDELR